MAKAQQKQNNLPIPISVMVSMQNGKPSIQLRTYITNYEKMKEIISSAFHETPVVFQPKFTSRIHSLNSLIEKGIIYKERVLVDGKETDQFFFTF